MSYSTSHELCNIMWIWGFQWAFQRVMIYHEVTCNTEGFGSIFLLFFCILVGEGWETVKNISNNHSDSVKKMLRKHLQINWVQIISVYSKHLTCQNYISDSQQSFICPNNVNFSCHVISLKKCVYMYQMYNLY